MESVLTNLKVKAMRLRGIVDWIDRGIGVHIYRGEIYIYRGEEILRFIETEPIKISSYPSNQPGQASARRLGSSPTHTHTHTRIHNIYICLTKSLVHPKVCKIMNHTREIVWSKCEML